MIDTFSVLLGGTLLLFAFVDVFMTVFMIGGGAGPQSRLVADRAWRLALRLHDPGSVRSHSLMRAAGPLIVLLALAIWVFELVVGWALVFVPAAFESPGIVSMGDRLAFAGKAVVGRSGNAPPLAVAGDGWETVNGFAGLSGVIIISVGLAYVLPILASVAHKRSVAASIHTLGDSVAEMRELGRTPGGSSFELHLVALVPAITLAAERHRSYPVLHYFHSHDRHAALAPAIAKIALLLRADLDGVDKVDATVTRPLEHAILNLFDALSNMGLARYARETAGIDADGLTGLEIGPSISSHHDVLSRAWLEAYVRFDGWDWDEVIGDASLPFPDGAKGTA